LSDYKTLLEKGNLSISTALTALKLFLIHWISACIKSRVASTKVLRVNDTLLGEFSTTRPKMPSFYLGTLSLRRVIFLVSSSVMLLSPTRGQNIPEISAHYGSMPSPFTLDVNPSFIATTELKVSLARIANDIGVPNLVDGPSTETAISTKSFWLKDYNWKSVQEELNQKYEAPHSIMVKDFLMAL
jgi:hypothetical protein